MFIDIFLIALGLSMDAFSVSITNGLCMKNIKKKEAFIIAFSFGFFQFFMPLIGYLFASIFKLYIEKVDHWIAFILLFFIGLKMILDARKEIKCDAEKEKNITFKLIFIQAIATSVDALAVGISFYALNMPLMISVLLIGLITFITCFIGVYIGKKAGGLLNGKAEIVGGAILIIIGLKILIEHLFF